MVDLSVNGQSMEGPPSSDEVDDGSFDEKSSRDGKRAIAGEKLYSRIIPLNCESSIAAFSPEAVAVIIARE